MRALRRLWRRREGAAAVELAFVLPAALFLALGGSNLILLLYSLVSLHAATESAARYAAMQLNTGAGVTASAVQTYGASHYRGPGLYALSFSYSTATGTWNCGGNNNVVTATATYHLYYGIGRLGLPVTLHSCFP